MLLLITLEKLLAPSLLILNWYEHFVILMLRWSQKIWLLGPSDPWHQYSIYFVDTGDINIQHTWKPSCYSININKVIQTTGDSAPKKSSVCKSRWPAQRTVVLHATPGWAGAGCRECACSGGDPVIAWQRTPSSRGSDLTRWVVMVVAAANTLSVSGVKWDHLPMLLWPN